MAADTLPMKHRRSSFWRGCRSAFRAALAVVMGEECVVCGRPLVGAGVCGDCWLRLPYTRLQGAVGNEIERLFWAEPRVERVSAFLVYKPEYKIAALVHAFKYHGRRDLACLMGRAMTRDLKATDFFDGVDAILPVPLSDRRKRRRGYNQSEALAEGVAEVLSLPVISTAVKRVVDNPSQTSLDPTERTENVKNIFALADAAALEYKRILIVDDVITVGATLLSLVRTLEGIRGLRIRILALCAAGTYRRGRVSEHDLGLPDLTAHYDPSAVRRYPAEERKTTPLL